MINIPFNTDLQITDAPPIGENGYSSIKHIKNARLAKGGDLINSYLTYIAGNSAKYGDRNFPILFSLDGKGRKKAISSLDGSFKDKVFGKPKVTDTVSATLIRTGNSATGRIGENGATFKICFKNKFFMRNEVISTGGLNGVKIHIHSDGERHQGKGFIYEAKVAERRSYIPEKYLLAGTVWATGLVKVSLHDSRGTTQRRAQAPFDLQNQLSKIRRSYNYSGNVASKKLTIPFKVDGKTINFWCDWEYYHDELRFKQDVNEDIIFSKYNKLPDGTINNIDADTQEPVPMGAGIWEQITNEVEYTILTKAKLDEIVSLALDTADLTGNTNSGEYIFACGEGLIEEVNRVLLGFLNNLILTSDNFIRGNDPMNMEVGTYFTKYKHPSGKLIKFVHERAFDRSGVAQTAERDPQNPTRPITSYSGMLLNCSDVEVSSGRKTVGSSLEPNITLVYEEGCEFQEWFVLGGAKIPFADIEKYQSRANDVDASSYHKMMTLGVHLNLPQTCVKLTKKIA